jgi:hypothetical protein
MHPLKDECGLAATSCMDSASAVGVFVGDSKHPHLFVYPCREGLTAITRVRQSLVWNPGPKERDKHTVLQRPIPACASA